MEEKLNGMCIVDSSINVTDHDNNCIEHEKDTCITTDYDGEMIRKFDLLGPVGEKLIEPMCISVCKTGEFAVTDTESCFVVIYDNLGNYLSHFSTLPKKLFYIFLDIDSYKPHDIAWLSSKRIVFTQPKGCRVMVTDWNGKCSVTIEGRPLYEPYGVAVDTGNNIFVTDRQKGRILCYSSDGKLIQTIGKFGSSDYILSFPQYIQISHNGDIYVNHTQKNKISIAIYNRNGAIKKTVMTDLDVGQETVIQPFTIDKSGNIFHVSSQRSSVSIVNETDNQVSCTGETDPLSGSNSSSREIDFNCNIGGIIYTDKKDLVYINQTETCVHIFPWRCWKING